jgi:hypothetical protein
MSGAVRPAGLAVAFSVELPCCYELGICIRFVHNVPDEGEVSYRGAQDL